MGSDVVRLALGPVATAIALCGSATVAQAQTVGDTAFQDFFRGTICTDLINGQNQQRCIDTVNPTIPGSAANISASSQTSLNPSQVAATAGTAARTAEALARQTERRLEALRDEDADKPGAETGRIAGFGPWSIFASVEGEWFEQSRGGADLERGFDGDRFRGTIGTDYRLSSQTVLGLAVSFEKAKLKFDGDPNGLSNAVGAAFNAPTSAGSRKADTWTVSGFMSSMLSDTVWVDLNAGYGWSSNRLRRNATYQAQFTPNTTSFTAIGSPDGKQLHASGGIGIDLAKGSFSFGPYARMRYVRTTVEGYTERDGGASGLTFVVEKQRASSLVQILGVRASWAVSTGWGVLVPQVRVEYEHEFKVDQRTTSVRFATQPTTNSLFLPVTSDRRDPNYLTAAAGLTFVLPHGTSLFVEYEGLLGYSNFERHRLGAGVRLEF